VPVELELDLPDERLPRAVEAAAYFAAAEALTNVDRYADASEAQVCVAVSEGQLEVTVRDDGVGGAELGAGSGLQGLRDRVSALNGTLALDSRPGDGTRVIARLPVTS
jgi:signal transduction histidine kinase